MGAIFILPLQVFGRIRFVHFFPLRFISFEVLLSFGCQDVAFLSDISILYAIFYIAKINCDKFSKHWFL